jgi:hypothetical protein
MSQVVNRGAPTFGGAIGYFLITAWAVPKGYLQPEHVAEGVVMAGILCTNVIMELKVFFRWVGSLIKKEPEK